MKSAAFWLVCGLSSVALVACGPSSRRSGGGGGGGGGGDAGAGPAGGGGAAGGGVGRAIGGGGDAGAGPVGGGGGGEVVEIDSGADEDLMLTDMTDDQIESLCEEVAQKSLEIFEKIDQQAMQHASCLFGGVFAEMFGGQCQPVYDECMRQPFGREEEACDITREKVDGCEATIGDVEACLGSLVGAGAQANEALAEAFGGKICRDMAEIMEDQQGGGDAGEGGGADDLTPECQAIEDQCPGITDDEAPEMGDAGGGDMGGPEFDG
jgi:hypothetical protein